MFRHQIILALALSVPLAVAANAPAATPWQTLSELQGSWRLTNPRTDGERAFRISFRPISRGSALVETFGNPAKNITETIYHRDGEKIMLTHYCAQGNQPRLVLASSNAPGTLAFRFFDVTNLTNKTDSHLVKIDFNILDRNRIERRETYTSQGVEQESILQLEREQ